MEEKIYLSVIAKRQWQDESLLSWRRNKTKQQWTSQFRKQRKDAYNKTYLRCSMEFLRSVYDKYGDIESYDRERKALPRRNNNILWYGILIAFSQPLKIALKLSPKSIFLFF